MIALSRWVCGQEHMILDPGCRKPQVIDTYLVTHNQGIFTFWQDVAGSTYASNTFHWFRTLPFKYFGRRSRTRRVRFFFFGAIFVVPIYQVLSPVKIVITLLRLSPIRFAPVFCVSCFIIRTGSFALLEATMNNIKAAFLNLGARQGVSKGCKDKGIRQQWRNFCAKRLPAAG